MTYDFLDLFKGKHVYCTVDDTKQVAGMSHWHEGYDKSREQILEELKSINASSTFGVFFCVNEIDRRLDQEPGKTKQRTAKMLTRIRAVFADDDEVRSEPRYDFPLTPSIIVESSPGKYHYYWIISDDVGVDTLDEWGAIQHGISETYGTDPNSVDAVRVLRLPGFLHHKSEPFETQFSSTDIEYTWDEITQGFPTSDRDARKNESSGSAKQSYSEVVESIIDGSNYHSSIMWLLNHWVNKGIDEPQELLDLIQFQLSKAKTKDERWDKRNELKYLKANIKDAITFVDDNPIDDVVHVDTIPDPVIEHNIEYPPGLMGDLCRDIYKMAPHPNEEVAIMGAYALVAGIVGRRYNVLGTGLNIYVALLADSGIGKANLKDSINHALLKVCALSGGAKFKGLARATGPKAIFDMLDKGLSRVCVLEESGLMQESTAGDQSGISRVLLDIYSSSGHGQFAGGEGYSTKENSIPILPSPALTIAHVSTPLSYIKAIKSKNAAVSGDIARMWTMRSLRPKSYLNMDRSDTFSKPVKDKIVELVKSCLDSQNREGPAPEEIDTHVIDIHKESSYWVDLENQYAKDGEQLKRTLCSRSFMKMIKLSAITSLFNGSKSIGSEEFEWAKSTVEIEVGCIDHTVNYGSTDDMSLVVTNVIAPTITKIINGEYKDVKKSPPLKLRGKGIFTATNLNQALRNCEQVKALNDDPSRPNPHSGIEKVVRVMLSSGLLVKVEPRRLANFGTKTKLAYAITDEFKLIFSPG